MSITNFLVFTIVSSVEYVAIFALMFSLFRIDYRGYMPHIIFVCISLSYLSFTIREDSLAFYAPFIQMLSLITLMWLLFRIQIFYASIISVIGYFLYGIIQLTIYSIASMFRPDIKQFTVEMQIVALISGLIAFFLSNIVYRKNWGFSFVPHSEDRRVNYRQKENMLLLFALLLSFIGLMSTYSFTVILDTPTSFISTLVFLILSVAILIYVSRKKDESEVS